MNIKSATIQEFFAAKNAPNLAEIQDVEIAFGSEVKASAKDPYTLERGYLLLFSGADDPDLVGDFFTPETKFGPHTTSLVWYDHCQDGTIKRTVLDPAAKIGIDTKGVWIDAQIDKATAYAKDIVNLAKAGKLGWSSGTASHLVEREDVKDGAGQVKARHITSWMLGIDASLTPTPCEPRTRPDIMPLKSYTQPTSFKALMEGIDTSGGVLTEDDLPTYTYPVNATVGHTLSSKMAQDHGRFLHQAYRNRTISTPEYDHTLRQFGPAMRTFHSGLNSDVANRDVDGWDDWEASYKALEKPGMKTMGDAMHALLTQSFNAGADHMLTRGYVTADEHKGMRDHFEKCRDGYLNNLNEAVRARDLKSNGTSSPAIKNSQDDTTLEDEAKSLLADAEAVSNNAKRLAARMTGLKDVRAAAGRALGPRACAHIDDVTGVLKSLMEDISALKPARSAMDVAGESVTKAKELLKSLGIS